MAIAAAQKNKLLSVIGDEVRIMSEIFIRELWLMFDF